MVAEEVVDDGLRRGGEQAVRHALAAELHHLLQRRAMAVVELQEVPDQPRRVIRSEENTSELQSLMRISYAVFYMNKKKTHPHQKYNYRTQTKTLHHI